MLAILCKKATMHELSDKRKTILLVAIIYVWIGSMLGEYFNSETETCVASYVVQCSDTGQIITTIIY